MTGCQVINARGRGVAAATAARRSASPTARSAAGQGDDKLPRGGAPWTRNCTHVMVINNFLGRGSDGDLELPAGAGTAAGNVTV